MKTLIGLPLFNLSVCCGFLDTYLSTLRVNDSLVIDSVFTFVSQPAMISIAFSTFALSWDDTASQLTLAVLLH